MNEFLIPNDMELHPNIGEKYQVQIPQLCEKHQTSTQNECK
jgi:hypothetical protein